MSFACPSSYTIALPPTEPLPGPQKTSYLPSSAFQCLLFWGFYTFAHVFVRLNDHQVVPLLVEKEDTKLSQYFFLHHSIAFYDEDVDDDDDDGEEDGDDDDDDDDGDEDDDGDDDGQVVLLLLTPPFYPLLYDNLLP